MNNSGEKNVLGQMDCMLPFPICAKTSQPYIIGFYFDWIGWFLFPFFKLLVLAVKSALYTQIRCISLGINMLQSLKTLGFGNSEKCAYVFPNEWYGRWNIMDIYIWWKYWVKTSQSLILMFSLHFGIRSNICFILSMCMHTYIWVVFGSKQM